MHEGEGEGESDRDQDPETGPAGRMDWMAVAVGLSQQVDFPNRRETGQQVVPEVAVEEQSCPIAVLAVQQRRWPDTLEGEHLEEAERSFGPAVHLPVRYVAIVDGL